MNDTQPPDKAASKAAKKAPKKKPFFQKQANMRRMLLALSPVAVSAVYFFGWRVVMILAIVFAAGICTEFIMARRRKASVSTACLVTCMLYGLSLPATVSPLVAVVGVVVAILFGKEVFGGFGKNFANPAIVGRAFVYISFPNDLTSQFVPAFKGFPGGFAHWSLPRLGRLPQYLQDTGRTVTDAISQASPMDVARKHGFEVLRNDGAGASLWDMATGAIGGTYQPPGQEQVSILSAGSMGEGCAIVIALAAIYLLWTKTANWRLMIPGFVGVLFANVLWRNLAGFDGPGEVPPLAWQLLSGTTVYAAVYMITDPVSAPKKKLAQLGYGFLIGFLIVTLRWLGVFVAAATFSILLGNLLGPLMDLGAGAWEDRKKARAKAREAAAGEAA
jgi:Na+-transporting NADH:ubiquinone oxidoreductase subunit B